MKEKNRITLFTRRMKKTHTILLPQMLEYHSDFLKAAFEGSGYRFETMREDTGLKDAALKYISSDYCYPAILIVGQVLKVLENGAFPNDKIAFMEPQAGGACRAGNYERTIMRTLRKCGQEQIPVISLNFKGEKRHPGFRITPRLLFSLEMAVCCGDLLMSLYQQTKPYEREAGVTDRTAACVKAEVAERIRRCEGVWGRKRRETYRYILDAFYAVPVRKLEKKKVCVTGEVYIKFSPLGNHRLEQFLERQNCECRTGGFLNYVIFAADCEKSSAELQCGVFPYGRIPPHDGISPHGGIIPHGGILPRFGTPLIWVYDLALRYLKRRQRELYTEIGAYGRYEADTPFDTLKGMAEGIISENCLTGDGWLVAAEAADAARRGFRHVLIVHPFGCLVSHICERGILKNLLQRYPDVNFQTVEYDYDSSDALRESRILLGLGERLRKKNLLQSAVRTDII